MKKLLVFFILMQTICSLVAQKSVSANLATIPYFFQGKQDLMTELNYEIGITKRGSLRPGFGFGYRNSTEHIEIDHEPVEINEKYAVICGILSWKYYPFFKSKINNGLYGGFMLQSGFMHLENETMYQSAIRSGDAGLYTFVKGGFIGGYTLLLFEHWLVEPELGFLPGKRFGVLSKHATLNNRLRIALNIGYRF